MNFEESVYDVTNVCAFSKAKDPWGEFGNMCGGFSIRIFRDEHPVPSTENLYQMMRFTGHPEIQREIFDQKSGMGAKMIAKKYRRDFTRPDFEDIKVDIMHWCLSLKYRQHKKYRGLLELTGSRDIVEISKKDPFWGAKPQVDENILVGANVLGQLHMIVRDEYVLTKPLNVENFVIFGREL